MRKKRKNTAILVSNSALNRTKKLGDSLRFAAASGDLGPDGGGVAAGGIGGKKKMGEKIENGRFFFLKGRREKGKGRRFYLLLLMCSSQRPLHVGV